MDIASKGNTHTFVEDVCERIASNITRIYAMQNHWRAAAERFKNVRPQLLAYITNNCGQYNDRMHVHQTHRC